MITTYGPINNANNKTIQSLPICLFGVVHENDEMAEKKEEFLILTYVCRKHNIHCARPGRADRKQIRNVRKWARVCVAVKSNVRKFVKSTFVYLHVQAPRNGSERLIDILLLFAAMELYAFKPKACDDIIFYRNEQSGF